MSGGAANQSGEEGGGEVRILALDLATRTGWALWDGTRIESGVQDFAKQRGESNGMLFLKFNRWLAGVGNGQVWPKAPGHEGFGFCPLLIVYEAPHHRGGHATEIAVGLATRVQEFCALRNLECSPVHSMTLKKWATGSGRADKSMMMKRAYEISKSHLITDDNEGDALCLLGYALEKFGGETSCNARPAAAAEQR